MRRRFFVDGFADGRASLRGEAALHLGRVLRAQPGQVYELSDGRTVWLGKVESAAKSCVEFTLTEALPARAPGLHTSLLLSIVKFDHFEWCLEKATELGVAEVFPIAAERSEKGLIAAAAKRSDRWRKILLESAQQSRRLAPPVLHPAAELAVQIAGISRDALRILLSERAGAKPLRKALTGRETAFAALAIGPAGGWSEREFGAFEKAGFSEGSLGTLILRTETAVIAALAAMHYALGEDS